MKIRKIFTHFYMMVITTSFLSIQLLNELSYPFHITYSLSLFLLIIFSTLNSWYVLQFFLIKRSINFFTIKIINNVWPWNGIFDFTNYKNFRPTRSIPFSKNVFALWNSYSIVYFKFCIFSSRINAIQKQLLEVFYEKSCS